MPGRMWQRDREGRIIRAQPSPPMPAGPDGDRAAAGPVGNARRRASLGLALRLGLRDTYDYLGAVLLLSGVWSITATTALLGGQAVGRAVFGALPGLLPLLLTTLAALAGLALAGGPLLAGVFRFARNAAARREPEVFDLAWGFRSALGSSLRLAAVQILGALLLAANGYFYISQRQPLLVVVGAMFGYALAFWGMMSLYQWPLLAEQEIPVGRVIRKSALLVLDNFAFSFVLGTVCLVLTLLLWVTMAGGLLLWAGMVGMLLTQAARELLRRYGVLPPDPTLDPIAEETHEFGGRGWHE
jgi:uncharacterized membrane protein YesL